MKSKSVQQRVDEMRRPPSLANWVRLNTPRRDDTAKRITRFVLAKPRHSLAAVHKLITDYVTLGVTGDTIRKAIDAFANPLIRRLSHEIASAVLPWLDKHNVKGIQAFHGFAAPYPIGRKIIVPIKPTFTYNREGSLTPVFVIGWSSNPFTYFQHRLFATMVHRAILTQEGFEGSDALILFTPRMKFSKSAREVRSQWVSEVRLLTDAELREQFDRYGNALDDAVPVIFRELASRGEM